MPADPARRYASLSADVDGTSLIPPSQSRDRADRRARVLAVLACATVMVIIGRAAFGARTIFSKRTAPVGVHSPTQSPIATTSLGPTATTEPSPDPHRSTGPRRPRHRVRTSRVNQQARPRGASFGTPHAPPTAALADPGQPVEQLLHFGRAFSRRGLIAGAQSGAPIADDATYSRT